MVTPTSSHTRTFHLMAALLSTAIFLLLIRLLPSLKTASDREVIVKCVAEVAVAVAILYGLVRLGREPPAALGLRRVRGATFGWAFLCFLASAIFSALTLFLFARFGIAQDKATLMALASRPAPIILLIAAAAGIAEEIIFRSILITELEAATGMRWLAAILSLAAFALAHAGGWGPSQIIFAAVPGLVLTLFFLWKRDLWICILAHFLTDAAGLLSAAAGMAHQH
jgi:membrane protease YdiL (CAAX protease family)